VSGVGPGIGVVDGVHVPQEKRRFGGFSTPIGLNGIFEYILKTQTYSTNA